MIRIFLFILFGFPFAVLSQQWRDLNGGVDGSVHAMYVDSVTNKLYVAGNFQHAGSLFTSCVAVWDSLQWSGLGNDTIKGLSDVRCIVEFNGDVIIGGFFDSIGMVRMNNISRWDGTSWNPMGPGFSDAVISLHEYKGELYAGGSFLYSGNDTIKHVAKWNGTGWVNLPGGLNFDYDVATFINYDSLLILGGYFNYFPSIPNSSKLIGFDGQDWISLNSTFNGFVLALELFDDTLYAAGEFTAYPNAPSNFISKFDGHDWQSMPYPTGGTNWITDMAVFQNRLVVVGYFTNPEDIGIFNGVTYDSIGEAFGSVFRCSVYKNELYFAGGFNQIGNINTFSIARYSDHIQNSTSGIDVNEYIQIYPNPITNNFFHLQSNISNPETLNITAWNVFGQEVSLTQKNGAYYFEKPAQGIYFIKIFNKEKVLKTSPVLIIKS